LVSKRIIEQHIENLIIHLEHLSYYPDISPTPPLIFTLHKNTLFGLNLAYEALYFQNEATYLKSETHIGSTNDWPVSIPDMM